MAAFGITLRPTASPLLSSPTSSSSPSLSFSDGAEPSSSSAAAASGPMMLRCTAGAGAAPGLGSLQAMAIELLCARQRLPLRKQEVSLMRGTPSPPTPPTPAAAAAVASASDAPSLSPQPPTLQDGDTMVSGWVSCLRYLAWKQLQQRPPPQQQQQQQQQVDEATAGFYPLPPGMQLAPQTAAHSRGHSAPRPASSGAPTTANGVPSAAVAVAATTGAAPAAASSVSCFAIDSLVEHMLSTFEPALEGLTHVFVVGAMRAGHAGPLPFLAHRFDRDGARLIPRWMQQVPHTIVSTGANHAPTSASSPSVPAPSPLADDVQAQQYILERLVRSLHAFVAEMQERLQKANPHFTTEDAMEFLRLEALALVAPPPPPATAAASSSSLSPSPAPLSGSPGPITVAVSEQGEAAAASSSTVPSTQAVAFSQQHHPLQQSPHPVASSSGAPFHFLLSTPYHTLADLVAFVLLARLPLLHSFLPLITPRAQPHLFVFVSLMTRIYCPTAGDAASTTFCSSFASAVGLEPGKHLLLCRHPLLRLHVPLAPVVECTKELKDKEKDSHHHHHHHSDKEDSVSFASSIESNSSSLSSSPVSSTAAAVGLTVTLPPASSSSTTTAQGEDSATAVPNALSPSSSTNSSSSLQVPGVGSADSTTTAAGGPHHHTRSSSTSMAVEEVSDLLDFVDRAPVRARGTVAPPAMWAAKAAAAAASSSSSAAVAPSPSPSPSPAPASSPSSSATVAPHGPLPPLPRKQHVADRSAASGATAAAAASSPVSSPSSSSSTSSSSVLLPPAALGVSSSSSSSCAVPPPPAVSSLTWSRVLAQRLASAVDHAPLHWRQVSDKQTVRLLAPIATDPDLQIPTAGGSGSGSGSGGGNGSSFRSLAVSTFPVSPAVVLSFLWSMECYKLLDPLAVLEARELAPHALAPSKAKFSYLSLELKCTRSTATNTNPAATTVTTTPAGGVGVGTEPSSLSLTTKTSSARVDFVLLNSWRRRLDGSYVLVQQSVPEDGLAEINAPKKFQKGCIRGSMGGPDSVGVGGGGATTAAPGSLEARRLAYAAATGGVSGWVLRPYYVDGVTPACEVSYLCCTSFSARMGAWIGPELERRVAQTVVALKGRLRALMGAHPLVRLSLPAPGSAVNDPAAIAAAAHAHAHSGGGGGSANGHGHGSASGVAGANGLLARHHHHHHHHHHAGAAPLHFSLSQPVPVSLVHAVSAAGVQTTPHPRGKAR